MAITQVEQIRVGELRLNPANVRKPFRKQIAHIIKQVGFLGAVTPRMLADVRALMGRDRQSHVP
jgi:hypothetical protein